ncbi:MAG: hypothetical protein H7122_12070 [Chitinophagaceae bacterium]|nr:hypothetical protein [Chitinophagaceae bacterium]
MENQIDDIVGHLFHKKRLDDVSETELEQFIATYPYFAVGHFLLAKKTQLTFSPRSNEKVAATGVYYHNALWLQWLLDQDLSTDQKKTVIEEFVPHNNNNEVFQEQVIDSGTPADLPHAEAVERKENSEATDNDASPQMDHTSPVDELPSASENIMEHLPRIQEEEKVPAYDTFNDNREFGNGAENKFDSSEQDLKVEADQRMYEDDHVNDLSPNSTIPVEETAPVSDLHTASEPEIEENISSQISEDKQVFLAPETEVGGDAQKNSEEAESRASAASIERTLTTAALIPTKAELEKNDFSFEPYHTIDYFASQGIKLQQADLSKDKFGKQLKSFTEWLRSMKRLPQAATEANLDEATQQSIQQIAEHSFEEKEIVTETMADVWIKQGNREKAIDTLHKLSLLNPSKSHYFAAKIEQLKV